MSPEPRSPAIKTPAALGLGGVFGLLSRIGGSVADWARLGKAADASAGARAGEGLARPASGIRVAGTGGEIAPATLVREIRRGEKVVNLVGELAERTYVTRGIEHAIVSTTAGKRLILRGGSGGIDFGAIPVRRVILHTHPSTTGPSFDDFVMLDTTGQTKSWIYELFGGGLSPFRRK